MQIMMIAAVDDQMGIARGGKIPWVMREDLRQFLQITRGDLQGKEQNAVIMGRKTWDSLPVKPLPGRSNLVLTSHPLSGVAQAASLSEAVSICRQKNIPKVFLIGGQRVFNEGLSIAQKILLSRIPGDFGCDTFFPPFEESGFIRIQRQWVADAATMQPSGTETHGFWRETYVIQHSPK